MLLTILVKLIYFLIYFFSLLVNLLHLAICDLYPSIVMVKYFLELTSVSTVLGIWMGDTKLIRQNYMKK